jgi:pimeloyl-ACP methyl ester carboxylesterase
VLVHEGIADSRMWDPQWASWADRHRLLRFDMEGFGRSPIESETLIYARDVVALLDELGIAGAALVGVSMGARVALEVALARPDLAGALVLVAAGVPNDDWTAEMNAHGEREYELVIAGELDEATELSMRFWVDGPRRSPSDVDPAVRGAVTEMYRRALELQAPFYETVDEELLVPDVTKRIGEIAVPTLVLVGEEDVEDMHRIGRLLAEEIPGARHATIADTAHVPSLERPGAFDALVLDFLAEALA